MVGIDDQRHNGVTLHLSLHLGDESGSCAAVAYQVVRCGRGNGLQVSLSVAAHCKQSAQRAVAAALDAAGRAVRAAPAKRTAGVVANVPSRQFSYKLSLSTAPSVFLN